MEENEVLDANGNVLHPGDNVIVVKDLKVKGSSKGLKKGTKVKNIRLTDELEGLTGKIEGMKGIYISVTFKPLLKEYFFRYIFYYKLMVFFL